MIHRRLLQLAGAVPGSILLLGLVGLLISALNLGFALVLAGAIASLVRGDADLASALVPLVAVTIARGALIWIREPLAARIGASVRIGLRRRLLERLRSVPASSRDSGSTAATIIDGVDGLDGYYARYLPQLLVVLVVPATVVAVTSTISRSAGVVLALAAAIAVLAPRAWDALLLKNGRTRWERFARLSSDYVEALQNIPLLRGFGADARTATRLAGDAEELRLSTMRQLRLSLAETAVSALAMHLGVILAVGAVLLPAATGDAAGVEAVAVLLLARECFRPVQDLGTHWHAGYLGLSAVDGLDRLMSLGDSARLTGTIREPAADGGIDIESVAYRYPATDAGLSGVDLRIGPGEKVAILGPSGSGKSTLARLLERESDPDSGRILIGGSDLRDLSPDARSRSVVVVPQDPTLFAWTVRDNLRLYRPQASEAEIVDAARSAGIHDVVCELADGYGTVLGENGEQLSGGQRQRLAVARALVSSAPVLVLDEVTSALDADTEQHVMDGVVRAAPERTIVFIAHRESACRHAQRWIALDDGRIAAAGDGPPPLGVLTRQGTS